VSANGRPLAARALVLDRHGAEPSLADVIVDPPGPGEVRVRMLAAGVCHTDLAATRDARTVPIVLGHEGMGVVECVGAGVDGVRAGTRVLLAWKTPCGSCRRCAQQRSHLCESPQGTAAPRVHRDGIALAVLLDTGCLCTFAVVPSNAVVPVPDELGDAEAALVGCAVATGVGAALRTASVEAGDVVGVWGAGGVGSAVVAGARLALADAIVAVEIDRARRADALAWGATAACHPDEAAAVIAEVTRGRGLDVAFEVVGEPGLMAAAVDALGVGGTLVLVGAAARDAELAFAPRRFMSRQQRIVGCIYGSVRPRVDLPVLLDLCAAGAIPVGDLIGREVSFEELPAALGRPHGGIRTVVRFP
jgi:S-(hydroxymethyl)glutathione dehydrogenase/alcohol dehydrogenase